MAAYRYCLRCRRTLSRREIEEGLVTEVPDGLICSECAETSPAPGGSQEPTPIAPEPEEPVRAAIEREEPAPTAEEEPEGEDPIDILKDILRELRDIRQSTTFEKSSIWNVLAVVMQCFAVGVLFVAGMRWATSGQIFLNLAIVLQLMALTFFFKGRD